MLCTCVAFHLSAVHVIVWPHLTIKACLALVIARILSAFLVCLVLSSDHGSMPSDHDGLGQHFWVWGLWQWMCQFIAAVFCRSWDSERIDFLETMCSQTSSSVLHVQINGRKRKGQECMMGYLKCASRLLLH